MKVITLYQPWAWLMVLGLKRVETRPRNFTYKGPLGIHAAQYKHDGFAQLCKQPPFNEYIDDYDALPFGAIIGQVKVIGSCSTDFIVKYHDLIKGIINWEVEKEFGNYGPGRTGILCEQPEMFLISTPARGFQSMPWSFDDSKLLHLSNQY